VDEATWRTAGRCDGGTCVEIGVLGRLILIRSSADPDGVRIALSRGEWREFVAGVKDGEFDGL
jgi:predicted secreted Zn-dependent protease